MDAAAQTIERIGVESAQAQARATADRGWPELLLAVGATSIVVGLLWDISWHISIGRDTFWTPAHMAIYVGGLLGGCVGGWLAIEHTFFRARREQGTAISVFGLRAPLGAWVAIWGALAMITSAPFDDWWHNAYGLDVKIISPPHAVLGLGMFGISAGAVLLALARQNRAVEREERQERVERETAHDVSHAPRSHASDALRSTAPSALLFIYAGGIFVLMGAVFITEYTFPNIQHAAVFYKACAIMIPFRLVGLGRAGRISWPTTRIAAVYMGLLCLMIWILPLFPAQPRLAPIYNQVTHMVPPAFPLLLIFPAAAIDLVLRAIPSGPSSINNRWWKNVALAMVLGAVFLAVLMAVQWFFAKFMLSHYADNWFFAGNRMFGYTSGTGKWRTQFWHVDRVRSDADLVNFSAILMSWVFASVGAWIGLLWGGWMRKVRR